MSAIVTVTISSMQFDPFQVAINVGDKVRWDNSDSVAHTSTSNDFTSWENQWDSGQIEPGQTFEHIFNTAGTYSYYCKLSTGMYGVIMVT